MKKSGFDPTTDWVRVLMCKARDSGIKVYPRAYGKKQTRIVICHNRWAEGILATKKVRQGFAIFCEALRSFDHAIDSVLDRAALCEEQKQQVGNLYELRNCLGINEESDRKGVLELLDDDNLGGACCLVASRLQRLPDNEFLRIFRGIVPAILARKKLLSSIYEHDQRSAGDFYSALVLTVGEIVSARTNHIIPPGLVDRVESFVTTYPDPYPRKLNQARNAMVFIKHKLEGGELDENCRRAWRDAISQTQEELGWLALEHSAKQIPLFKGAA
ncbi:MAG: hypothetical protein UY73_C0031G0008 [Parcubacteria group bacterium GW2011_GWA2_52_8]|nr:MAG: hypothetical protein UY73_C0031G0008 [Parcubacteria group bacterium GW2011_GWA2_52_8]